MATILRIDAQGQEIADALVEALSKACSGKPMKKANAADPEDEDEKKRREREELEKANKKDDEDSDDEDDVGDDEDDDDEDEPPDFDDEDFTETDAYKQFAPLVRTAYKFWLAAMKDGKEPPKEYKWAKPEEKEKPKDFAVRIADELRNTKEAKAVTKMVGEGADYYDFVEAIMRFDSGMDNKELSKAMEAAGTFDSMYQESKKAARNDMSTMGLTNKECMELRTHLLRLRVAEYFRSVEAWKQEQSISVDPVAPFFDPPEGFIGHVVSCCIEEIIWATTEYKADRCLNLKIARHLGGIDAFVDWLRKTLIAELKAVGLIVEDDAAE